MKAKKSVAVSFKLLVLVVASVGVSAAFAKETTVSTVEELVAALPEHTAISDRIWLNPGVYDLTGVQMEEDSSCGGSHLVYCGTWIMGKGEKPEDTVLLGDGTKRIIHCTANAGYQGPYGCRLGNLMITNGYAKTVSGVANSGYGGGLLGLPIVTNCVIVGCKADGGGGGASGGAYIRSSKILSNWTGGRGGGALKAGEIFSCEVRGNEAVGNGGGLAGADTTGTGGTGTVRDSVIAENVSGGSGGGSFWVPTFERTLITANQAATDSGGAFTWSGTLTDCTVCSNRAYRESGTSYAGGIMYFTMNGGKIFANYAKSGGGGAYGSTLTGVEIFDNYAGGSGGGVAGNDTMPSVCTDCVIRDNFSAGAGGNVSDVRLVRCDVSGTTLAGGSAVDCRIHDIPAVKTISGNPWNTTASHSNPSIWSGIPIATNCLFYSNQTIGYSATMFVADSSSPRGISLVNCTIVSNKYGKTFNYTNPNGPSRIKNCVFFGNQAHDSTSVRDIHSWENTSAGTIFFENCAYGKASGQFADMSKYASGPLYKFGTDGFPAKPGFMGEQDPEHPYALKRSSPLRGRGAYADWMASATDIRGEGYARATEDHKVDIGCYQCWLPAPGMMLFVR